MTDEERILYVMLNLGIKVSSDGKVICTFEQFNELKKVLKEQYDIKLEDVLCVNQKETDNSTSELPSFFHFNTYPDGKARRRERRKQERMKKKKKHVYNNDSRNKFDDGMSELIKLINREKCGAMKLSSDFNEPYNGICKECE